MQLELSNADLNTIAMALQAMKNSADGVLFNLQQQAKQAQPAPEVPPPAAV